MATPTPSVYTYETVQKYWAYTSAVYGANGDPARTPLVVGSATPVAVDQFKPTPDSGFGGALYKDASTGRYTLAFTGSETGALKDFVQDWGKADGKLYVQDMAAAMGTYTRVWNPQFTDAMNFAYGAVKQIYSDLVKTEGDQDVSMDDIRARLDVTGHSLGGALAELVGKLFGLKGANIDGPGVTALVSSQEFKDFQARVAADPDAPQGFQSNYVRESGDFVAYAASLVGVAGTHLGDTGFQAEAGAESSYYAANLGIFGGVVAGNPIVLGAGMLSLIQSGLKHPGGAILARVEKALGVEPQSVETASSVDLWQVQGVPQWDLYAKTPSATTYSIFVGWLAQKRAGNIENGLSPSGLKINGDAQVKGDLSVRAVLLEDGTIREIVTPTSGGAPSYKDFKVMPDGQLGLVKPNGSLEFLIPARSDATGPTMGGVMNLTNQNELVVTPLGVKNAITSVFLLSEAEANAIRAGKQSAADVFSERIGNIFDFASDPKGHPMAADQIDFNGNTYNPDGNGYYTRSLGDGYSDVLDAQGQRYLEDPHHQRTLVGTGKTIVLSDSGVPSVMDEYRPDAAPATNQSNVVEYQNNGAIKVTIQDATGQAVAVRLTTIHDDGSSQTDTTNTQTGTTSSVTRDSDGNIYQRSDTQLQPDGTSVTQVYNRAGDLLSTTARKVEDDGSYTETVTNDKGTVKNTYDSEGELHSSESVDSGLSNLGYVAGAATSFLSLVKALQAGKPLPIVVAGINTLAAFDKLSTNGYGASNLTLSGTQNVLGAATSLYNLSVAWKQGDATGVFAAGASSLYYGGTAYANMLGYSNVGAAAASGAISSEVAGAIGAAGQVMPYLNLVNSLAHGDTTGAALAAVSIAFPVAGAVIGIASMVFGMFDDPPTPWGNGNFAFNEDGTIRINATGGDGGYEPVYGTLAAYQTSLGNIVSQYNQASPKAQIGLIANRMGSLSYNGGQWTLTTLSPETGGQITLHYGSDGKVQDAQAGTPEYFRSMGEQYIYSALQSGAIAAGWEVQTAKTQSALGDPMAGLSETQRAQRANQYLGAQHTTSVGTTGNLGSWRAIGLDLNGDGIQTVSEQSSGVVFDVDGTGFAKQTAWVGKQDGMLVLDRNFNGVIDSGSELFGNTQVALGEQGLKGLAWVDANVDGNIDSQDAVYSQLRVWQDANGNGLVDNGEAKSLSEMGISAIHYNRGSYDKNGQSLQISSVDLQVDSVGTKVEQVTGGIKIESTDGHVSVLVTKTDDLSNIAPGKDGVQGIEDVQLDMLTASLLANDKVLGSNKSLSITAVGGAQAAANDNNWRIAA